MIIHVVNVIDGNGKILIQREFNCSVERQMYADLLVDILSYIESRKVKDVKKEILKENKSLKPILSSAREIEEKFVITETIIEKA